jgi:hypothetical protein
MTTWITECPDPETWTAYLTARSTQMANGCIVFTGHLNRYGYGRFAAVIDGKRRYTSAHRAAWLAMVGPIPVGLLPDHLCRNRACINIEHLEIVSNAENIRRGKSGLCKRNTGQLGPNYPCGHPRSAENSRRQAGRRTGSVWLACRECAKRRSREWARRRARASA